MKEISYCIYNLGVECAGSSRPCHKCGWNPSVHKERVQTISVQRTVKQT